jgi:hypothetical protein
MSTDTIAPTAFAKAMGIEPHQFRDFLIKNNVPAVVEFNRGRNIHRLYLKEVLMKQYPLYKESKESPQATLPDIVPAGRKPRTRIDAGKVNAMMEEIGEIKKMLALIIRELGIKPTVPLVKPLPGQLTLPEINTPMENF